jgi:hypothetical protein
MEPRKKGKRNRDDASVEFAVTDRWAGPSLFVDRYNGDDEVKASGDATRFLSVAFKVHPCATSNVAIDNLTINLTQVRAADENGATFAVYGVNTLPSLLQQPSVVATLKDSYQPIVTDDFGVLIDNSDSVHPKAELTLKKALAVFSLAFQVPKDDVDTSTGDHTFVFQNLGQKPVILKLSARKAAKGSKAHARG